MGGSGGNGPGGNHLEHLVAEGMAVEGKGIFGGMFKGNLREIVLVLLVAGGGNGGRNPGGNGGKELRISLWHFCIIGGISIEKD